ncbi:hypothetical protein TKK_0002307 [Trichogramma kaykai]
MALFSRHLPPVASSVLATLRRGLGDDVLVVEQRFSATAAANNTGSHHLASSSAADFAESTPAATTAAAGQLRESDAGFSPQQSFNGSLMQDLYWADIEDYSYEEWRAFARP